MRYPVKALVFLLVVVIGGWSRPASAGEANLPTVRFVQSGRTASSWPLFVAEEKKFFQKNGIYVEEIIINGGPNTTRAVLSNTIPIGRINPDYIIEAMEKGAKVKIISGALEKIPYDVVARPEIKTGADIKGKTIGVDSFAGTVDYLARVTVRQFGLDPDKDVKIIVSGESPVRLAALKAGAIDATAIDVAFAVKAEEEGMRRILNLAELIDLPLSGIGVTDKKLQTEREQIKKVVRATIRGTRFMKENRPETLAMMTDYLRITPAQAAQAYAAAIGSFTDDGYISDKGVLLDINLTRERLKLAKEIPLSQVVDWSLLKEIKSGAR